ncbi:MAG: osmoprotectant transport system substrate-binding protein [Mycobacterium sp.]|nr:osmoprotectant transport system substrate-binding protein [Mycobacterium sp.]
MRKDLLKVAAALMVLVVGVTGCGAGRTSHDGVAASGPTSLVVASSDFPESKVLAEIYAQALEANSFTVGRRHAIGSRETYMPAIMNGTIDLVADYMGNLLHYFDPHATVTTLELIDQELRRKLPQQLLILNPSPAVDSDAITVTADTAKRWNLHAIGDLKPHEAEVKMAAPPEFAVRPHGLPGLKEKYGIEIRPENFLPFSDGGGPATVRALVHGTVQAADIFSSLPAIPQNELVVLKDPNNLFLANNVVPLVTARKASAELKRVLDAISAKLTTAGLIGLNTAVSGRTGVRPEDAARKWLRVNGFDKPLAS